MPSNSPFALYAATIVFSLCIGYFAGIGTSLPITRSLDNNEPPDKETTLGIESENGADGSADGDLSILKAKSQEECKLGSPVLVVRSDLGMSSGKIAAQCSHATLACYKALRHSNPSLLSQWETTGQTKIALCCEDEEELLLLQAQAQSLNLCAQSIQDAGRTQIAAGSRTVVGIGPGPVQLINQVTGKLRLL